jgi:hypothetical protein
MVETNDKPVPLLAQRYEMVKDYTGLLEGNEHLWVNLRMLTLRTAASNPESTLAGIKDHDLRDRRGLQMIFDPTEPPYWAVEHLYRKGVISQAWGDICYGTVPKGEGIEEYHESMVKIINDIADRGDLDLAFNLMMAWNLSYALGDSVIARFDPKDFSRRLYVKDAISSSVNFEREFTEAILRKDHRTALNIASHAGRANLHFRAIDLVNRVIYVLREPETDDEKVMLMTAIAIEMTELEMLLSPQTYSRKIPEVKYQL